MSALEFSGFALSLFDMVDVTVPAVILFVVGGLLAVLMLWYYFRRYRHRSATIKYSDIRIVKRAARSSRQKFRPLLVGLRILALALMFVALARPRAGTEVVDVSSEGIDIMLILDISSSMQAEDFKPNNRLYVAKEEIKKFIAKRPNDRIGLVVFARYAFTQCPLTVDHGVLLSFVDQVTFGMVEDATAIGMAVATAANRLRESPAKSKIMVLLTDGDNNAGEIDPITSANLAAALDIKVYTIGAGKPGNAMYPIQDPLFGKRYVYQPVKIDEETLTEIANRTGGKYYRARSGEELDKIYAEIDQLEKTEINVSARIQYRELFQPLLYGALGFLVLELVLGSTYFRKLP